MNIIIRDDGDNPQFFFLLIVQEAAEYTHLPENIYTHMRTCLPVYAILSFFVLVHISFRFATYSLYDTLSFSR